jgi:hypothetical protein
MSAGAVTHETARGPRATQIVDSIDTIEPELAAFVRGTARWLDPWFPQRGRRGPNERGGWTDDKQVETLMQQVEELDAEGRGLRIIRLYRVVTPGGPHEGAVRVIAVGLANGAQLELRWNVVASSQDVRGTSAELTVKGPQHEACVADFHEWFGVTTS